MPRLRSDEGLLRLVRTLKKTPLANRGRRDGCRWDVDGVKDNEVAGVVGTHDTVTTVLLCRSREILLRISKAR